MNYLIVLFFSIFLFNISHSQCLSGTYIIGPDLGDDYPTLDSAVNHIALEGMCATVNFKIKSGTYSNTQVIIPEIFGNSSSNQLIIESQSGIPSSTVLQRGSSSSDNYVLLLEGVKYLELKNLTIKRASIANNYATVIDISDTISSLTFENLLISTPSYNYSNSDRHLITSHAVIDTFLIVGSSFVSGQSGFIASTINTINSFRLSDCSFYGQYAYGAYVGNAQSIHISENDFNLQSNADPSYILNLRGESITITRNTFLHKDNAGSPAVRANGLNNPQSSIHFSNNFIHGNPGSPYQMKGAYFENFGAVYFYFNTIKTRGDNLHLFNNIDVDIRNNILDNQAIYKSLILQSNTSVQSDYNCFNNASQAPKIEYNGALFSNFSDYQTITGLDNNSLSHPPNYGIDYHVVDLILNSSGITIPSVSEDIEGDLRETPPDIGADEFLPPPVELNLLAFDNVEQKMCPGLTPLFCNVANMGFDTINSIHFTLTVNGNFHSNFLWNGTIPSLDTLSIQFGSLDFIDMGSYTLELLVDSVNNQLDYNNTNNSLSFYNIKTNMQGVYTIGYQQGDFDYLYDALHELNIRKTCGTVVFEFEDALHQFYEDPLTATLPLQLNGVNEDSVIFRPQNPIDNGEYRAAINSFDLKTNNCSKLFFEDLAFHKSSFEITWSDSIEFSNNYFKSNPTSSNYFPGNATITVLFSDEISLKENTFVHGASSLDINQSNRVLIDRCTFKDIGSQAIHVEESDSIFIINNHFDLGATTTDNGIFMSLCGFFEILNNDFSILNAPALSVSLIPSSGSTAPQRLFANNSVIVKNSRAIDWYGFRKFKMVHNTFFVKGSTPSSVLNFEYSTSSQDDIYFEHNLLKNATGGTFYEGGLLTGGYVNFNAYDTLSTTFHPSATSFPSWSSYGLDPNSVLSDIDFVGSQDLHVVNSLTPLIGNDTIHIQHDLDNRLRISPPSMGAYELRIDSVEITLLSDGLPTGVCGQSPYYDLYFTNTGTDTLFNGNFKCVINQMDTINVSWIGAVGNGDTSVVNFGLLENQYDDANNVQLYFSPEPYQHQAALIDDTINYNYSGTPMSGNYTIGGASPDFIHLQKAIDALNRRGVCDTVFLDIQLGTNPLSLDVVSISAPSVLLFSNIEGLDSAHLVVGTSQSSPPQIASQIVFDNVVNTTIEKLGLYTRIFYTNAIDWTGPGATYQNIAGYGGFRMKTSNCQNININSCIFQVNSQDAIAVLDHSHNITIDQNEFRSCGFVVRSLDASDSVSNVIISNNYVENVPYFESTGSLTTGAAIINSPQNSQTVSLYYLPDIHNLTIRNNKNVSASPLSVYIKNCQSGDPSCKKYGLEISNNHFRGSCYLNEVHGTASSRVKIYNNFFVSVTTTLVQNNGLGVIGSYVDIFHNSIRASNSPVYLKQTGTFGNGTFRMEKNLFINPSSTYDYWPNAPYLIFEYSDNNAFAGTPPSFTNFETNSISYAPTVVSNYDLHLTASSNPSSLNQVLTTPYDIDFEGRGLYTNYGADEYLEANSLDLATCIFEFVPNSCNDTITIYGIISNEGTTVINDYTLNFSWNNQPSSQYTSSIALGIQAVDTILFGSYPVVDGTSYPVDFQITQVNSTIDDNPSNDQLTTNYTHSENYTEIDMEICFGEELIIGNSFVSQSGIYIDTLSNITGCDSLIQYTVTVKPDIYINASNSGASLTAFSSSLNTYQWIDCQTGDSIAGASNWNYTPSYTGDFAVIVTRDGCTDTSDCIAWLSTNSILESVSFDVRVYPNPTLGNFTIKLGEEYSNADLKILNSIGQLISEKEYINTHQIDARIDGEPGVYFVQISTTKGILRIPLVVYN